jgi:hypothetical protein
LLVCLVLLGGLALPRANVIKVLLIGLATIASLAVFLVRCEINGFAALPLLLGSTLGGGWEPPWPWGPMHGCGSTGC